MCEQMEIESTNVNGTWCHRWSNDLIFVVNANPLSMVDNFGEYLKNILNSNAGLQVFNGNVENGFINITPDWSKLISIEVQTKKWLMNDTDKLHLKFYFEKEWAKNVLLDNFHENNYAKNLQGIAKYWSESCQSHPNEVFSEEEKYTKLNTICTDDIAGGKDVYAAYSLPKNKNIYIVKETYREQIREYKKKLKN
ncbi:hypothetical protein PULV_a3931 [Pseudoalteromonas ulvae UL12]|uniref:hypothetical protein n=1 Tax=Pseudoalteromonas ulvae TaxID=107327 RepID=UPI00186B7F66|nr:hypothetical protein [Pseudoalteromonas ulvae]MBE0362130.1 hypothetical protein [Pseudoalteromonas ulvae UL12]